MIGIVIALLSSLMTDAAVAGITVSIDPKNPLTVVVGGTHDLGFMT